MRLIDLGWNSHFEEYFLLEQQEGCIPGRISEENRGIFRVLTEREEYLSEVTGRIRYLAGSRRDLPAVGDWVVVFPRGDQRATIVSILPRQTALSRKVAGRSFEEQILAANLKTVLIVTSLNQDFNLRRIERYLATVWESGAKPVVLLNKADLVSDTARYCSSVESVAPSVPVHTVSAISGAGLESIGHYLQHGSTAAFIGSSGVGKSTLINSIAGTEILKVQTIRTGDDRGRHTTTSRQMILLPIGGIVIDTPGIREIQLWDSEQGLARAFYDLESFASGCKFRDCRHQGEPDCAVTLAVEAGELSAGRLNSFHKLLAELDYQESKTNHHARESRKRQAKQGCKNLRIKIRNKR